MLSVSAIRHYNIAGLIFGLYLFMRFLSALSVAMVSRDANMEKQEVRAVILKYLYKRNDGTRNF